ncbi:uncharacterized protein LOC132700377 [Cylas formicarius]|uniref:uncharacterized protein LOC132700377 n=1 Tax=Cylas formicarius TaxID=197179 RepID=UPI00295856A5|nr:uncharacterized protein LOC132700377 [Cylas formicarius]
MDKSLVITGEASETESEEEAEEIEIDLAHSIQGAVISGEDSESENETNASVDSAISALDQFQCQEEKFEKDSLLHQKLRETNNQLYNNIENFTQNLVTDTHKSLGAIDQQLMKSQVVLQGAVSSLKTLSINSLAIKNKLHSVLSSNFLPNVQVGKSC